MKRTSQKTKEWRIKNRHPCSDCGKLIEPCSQRCGGCATRQRHKDGVYITQRLDGHPRWKGGRIGDGKGYILILRPEHHLARKNGYVFEHIIVWEQSNQMDLPSGYVIHHLNGIKSDNRPHNLFALPKTGHTIHLVNQALQKQIRKLEAIIAQTHLL